MALRFRPCSRQEILLAWVYTARAAGRPRGTQVRAHGRSCHSSSIAPVRPMKQHVCPVGIHLYVAQALQDASPGAAAIVEEVGAGGWAAGGCKAVGEQLVHSPAAPVVPGGCDEDHGGRVVSVGTRGEEAGQDAGEEAHVPVGGRHREQSRPRPS